MSEHDEFADLLDRIVTDGELRACIDAAPVAALADAGVALTGEQKSGLLRVKTGLRAGRFSPPYVPVG